VRSFELATFRIQEPRSSRLSWPVVAYDYEPFANDADAAVALPRLDVSCRSARIRRELRGDARWSRSMASVSPRNPLSCFWSRPKVGSTSKRGPGEPEELTRHRQSSWAVVGVPLLRRVHRAGTNIGATLPHRASRSGAITGP